MNNPNMWEVQPTKTYWIYGIETDTVRKLMSERPDIVLMHNLPDLKNPEQIFDNNEKNLVVFDDLADELNKSPAYTKFLIAGARHRNCAVLTQSFSIRRP